MLMYKYKYKFSSVFYLHPNFQPELSWLHNRIKQHQILKMSSDTDSLIMQISSVPNFETTHVQLSNRAI